jgi:hypothetical protein
MAECSDRTITATEALVVLATSEHSLSLSLSPSPIPSASATPSISPSPSSFFRAHTATRHSIYNFVLLNQVNICTFVLVNQVSQYVSFRGSQGHAPTPFPLHPQQLHAPFVSVASPSSKGPAHSAGIQFTCFTSAQMLNLLALLVRSCLWPRRHPRGPHTPQALNLLALLVQKYNH